MSAVLIPFPTPRRASSFDAVLAAMDATGEPCGRIVADERRLVEIDMDEVWRRANASLAVVKADHLARPVRALPTGPAVDEATCERIDAAVHQLKTRAGGWAWEQDLADHAQRRDGR